MPLLLGASLVELASDEMLRSRLALFLEACDGNNDHYTCLDDNNHVKAMRAHV